MALSFLIQSRFFYLLKKNQRQTSSSPSYHASMMSDGSGLVFKLHVLLMGVTGLAFRSWYICQIKSINMHGYRWHLPLLRVLVMLPLSRFLFGWVTFRQHGAGGGIMTVTGENIRWKSSTNLRWKQVKLSKTTAVVLDSAENHRFHRSLPKTPIQ